MNTFASKRSQQGMALIASLLLLIVVTVMALSMFRSYGTQERIAGNTRDKQRALSAAISAQQFAEQWLQSGAAPAPTACVVGGGVVPAINGQVCTNAPTAAQLATIPWTSGIRYTQFTANQIANVSTTTTQLNGGVSAGDTGVGNGTTQATYWDAPIFYVTYLGTDADDPNQLVYQIDALGWGGQAGTVAVVESTFQIGSASGPKGL